MKTGIFFSQHFKNIPGPMVGPKFINFPELLEETLNKNNVELFEHQPVDREFLYRFHTKEMIDSLMSRAYSTNSLHSIGAVVKASKKIAEGQLRNALVFNSASGHHAGPDYAWGGTYANCVRPATTVLIEKYNFNKFSLIDTDRHHGDGDRAFFRDDTAVQHFCFCDDNYEDETNFCVDPGWTCTNENYLNLVKNRYFPVAKDFKPQIIYHFLGHDTCEGDYGDIGLTQEFYVDLVLSLKELADEICDGRLMVISGGGARRDVAEYIFPRIADILSD